MPTIFQKVQRIREEYFHELRDEKEKQFIEDMFDGLDGVPTNISDEEIDEYLTPRQVEWINDIYKSLIE